MEWGLEDPVIDLFTGREELTDGFEHEGQVRGTPRLLYFEEKFFLIVGTRWQWTRNNIRPFSRSRFERYAFLSNSAADASSKFIFLDPRMLSRTSVLFFKKMNLFTLMRH